MSNYDYIDLDTNDMHDVVIAYLLRCHQYPSDMDMDDYAEARYDLDGVYHDLDIICEDHELEIGDLDDDILAGVLEQHDVGQTLAVDIMLTGQGRQFGLGIAARTMDVVGPNYHDDDDSYIIVDLHLNTAKYGVASNIIDIHPYELADSWADEKELKQELLKQKDDEPAQYESMLLVASGYLDLTSRIKDIFDVKAPTLPVMWYHDGTREPVELPIHVVKDRLI